MSNFSHRGYEHRTGGYGRRRHKASGFNKRNGASSFVKGTAVLFVIVGAAALLYLFADNITPFLRSFRGDTETVSSSVETSDIAAKTQQSSQTDDTPKELPLAEGHFDEVNSSIFISHGAA